MKLHQLQYFVAMAETRNFSRAAEKCGISQPSLTRAIKKLEQELGGDLFHREGNRTQLTELGRTVRSHFEQALASTELARNEALDLLNVMTAQLRLGVMCTIGPSQLIGLIAHLNANVPQLDLRIRGGAGHDVVQWLLEDEVDVALIGLPKYPDELSSQPLYRERYVVGFPSGHRFEDMKEVPYADLIGERYLERLNCEYLDHLREVVPNAAIPLDVRYRSEHEDWIQAMILAGMGCACLPEYMSLFPNLLMRPLTEPEIWRTISLINVRGRPHSLAIDVFVRLCKSKKWP